MFCFSSPQTFVAAIDIAGYKSLLNNGNFKGTVFAPTNEGFAATLAELNITGAALLANKNLVRTVLNYHILPDDVLYRNDLAPLQDWGTNLDSQTVAVSNSVGNRIHRKCDSLSIPTEIYIYIYQIVQRKAIYI